MKIKKTKKYSKGGAIAGGAVSGLASGAQMGSMFGPLGTLIGGGIGAIGGGIFGGIGHNREKEARQRARMKEQEMASDMALRTAEINSKATLATYPTQGISAVDRFGMGGRLDMPLSMGNGGNMKDLGGGLKLFKGNKHEQGGIPLDMDNDMIADAEVEGGEAFEPKSGTVFSDRLKLSDDDASTIKDMTGITVKAGGTISDAVKNITSKVNKLEDTELPFSKETNQIMRKRMGSALDYLHQRQSEMAPQNTASFANGGQLAGMRELFGGDNIVSRPAMFGNGGKIPKYQFGTDPLLMQNALLPRYMQVPVGGAGGGFGYDPQDKFFTGRRGRIKGEPQFYSQPQREMRTIPIPQTPVVNDGYFATDIPDAPINIPSQDLSNSVTAGSTGSGGRVLPNLPLAPVEARNSFSNLPAIGGGAPELPSQMSPLMPQTSDVSVEAGGRGLNFGGNFNPGPILGHVGNYLNFRANKRDIGRLDTRVNPNFVEAPTFRWDDPSIAARNANNVSTRNAINSLRRNTTQGSGANIAAIRAGQIEGNNRIISDATQQRNRAMQTYSGMVNRTNQINAGIANNAEIMNTQLRNQKKALKQQNRRAFLDGVLGNIQTGMTNDYNNARLALAAKADGGTGVSGRILDDPELRRLMRLDNKFQFSFGR